MKTEKENQMEDVSLSIAIEIDPFRRIQPYSITQPNMCGGQYRLRCAENKKPMRILYKCFFFYFSHSSCIFHLHNFEMRRQVNYFVVACVCGYYAIAYGILIRFALPGIFFLIS